MGKVIVVTSGKGGVGKTTSTANLGTALALLGRTVAVVDADVGLRNLDIVMGLESRIVYTSMDVIEKQCELSKALVRDRRVDGLMLLAASQKNNKDDIQPEQMKAICDKLRTTHDFVLVDSPAGIERGFSNASAGADEAIVVTTPDVSAIRDADRIIGLLQNARIEPINLVLNRFSPQLVGNGSMMDQADVLDILNIELIGVVPEDSGVITSTNRGIPLVYEDGSPGAQAYMRIARRLTGQRIPIHNFEQKGILNNILNWFTRKR
ncbi:MAG: septum site-determining protein MinD [Candidatus Poribacteria bacterium]|nr:septum site-determining protein MinD [Candidatus Poribacteria bacterium]